MTPFLNFVNALNFINHRIYGEKFRRLLSTVKAALCTQYRMGRRDYGTVCLVGNVLMDAIREA